MSESQYVEWKESWRDEHLKRLCGFANAQGGVLEIGRDDRGRVIGLKDARRLLEELPNKLRDLLGIVAVEGNPGQLPEGWSFEKLLGLHPSQPCNPDVANAFFRAGEIEAWGRGIRRVMEACRAAETPEPRIRVEPGDFWFEFPFSKAYLEGIGRPEEGAGVSGGTTQETTQETTQKTSVETSVETPVKTPERILEELSADPTLTLAEMAARIGKSLRAVERSVSKLVKDGRLRHVGPRKSGRWEVREES